MLTQQKPEEAMDTFWYFVIILFVIIPAVVVWFGCVMDVIALPHYSGFKKALWVVGMLAFPLIGCVVYLLARPKDVVVTEPGMYDEIYGTGNNELPSAVTMSGRFAREGLPPSSELYR